MISKEDIRQIFREELEKLKTDVAQIVIVMLRTIETQKKRD